MDFHTHGRKLWNLLQRRWTICHSRRSQAQTLMQFQVAPTLSRYMAIEVSRHIQCRLSFISAAHFHQSLFLYVSDPQRNRWPDTGTRVLGCDNLSGCLAESKLDLKMKFRRSSSFCLRKWQNFASQFSLLFETLSQYSFGEQFLWVTILLDQCATRVYFHQNLEALTAY